MILTYSLVVPDGACFSSITIVEIKLRKETQVSKVMFSASCRTDSKRTDER